MNTAARTFLLAFACAAASVAETPRRLPPADDAAVHVAQVEAAWSAGAEPASPLVLVSPDYKLDFVFDKGFGITSTNLRERPNSLYIGGRVQQRYTGFTRDEATFTDGAGVTRPIRNRNNFDFERVRLKFQGTALDPRLSYIAELDGDADGGSNSDVLYYFFQFDAVDAFKIRLGRWRAIYGREWLLSSRYLRLADRSMATEFFRPAFSDGVWLIGDLPSELHYELGLTNGFATSTRRPFTLDDNLAVSGTLRWDPWGPYGKGFQDFDHHCDPVLRVGVSGAFAKSDDRSDVGFPLGDEGFVLRLTDGTLLADTGALAPGVRVLGVRVLQASVDAALKWRGWSVGGEYFARSLQDFTADGALPVTQITQRGYRVEAGVSLVPKRWDLNFQTSHVTGRAGTGFTYSMGVNRYLRGGDDRLNKITFDVTDVTSSPVTTTTTDLLAGDDGQFFRMQVQLGF